LGFSQYHPKREGHEKEKRTTAMIKQRERPNMDDRLRFFEHEGHRILLVDLSHCTAREVEEITRRVPDYVTTQPLGSTLILTDFGGASFDRDTLIAMKETAVFDRPYVKKSALFFKTSPNNRRRGNREPYHRGWRCEEVC